MFFHLGPLKNSFIFNTIFLLVLLCVDSYTSSFIVLSDTVQYVVKNSNYIHYILFLIVKPHNKSII